MYDIEIMGHPFLPLGVSEICRGLVDSLLKVNCRFRLHDIFNTQKTYESLNIQSYDRYFDYLVDEPFLKESIKIFVINADEVPLLMKLYGDDVLKEGYNIIYLAWELSSFPAKWLDNINLFDEIWTISSFSNKSININKPVTNMPLPVEIKFNELIPKKYFNIDEVKFTYMFAFDFSSFIERKNPWAVIEAYNKLIEDIYYKANTNCIIKLNSPENYADDYKKLVDRIDTNCDNFIIINKCLAQNEMFNLIRNIDCFISLHRAEGFGRIIAESMLLGKSTIITGYSGNMDFTKDDNSFLVNYKLIDIKKDEYADFENQKWADPDITQTLSLMKKVYSYDNDVMLKQDNAKIQIQTYHSYIACGLRYMNRLSKVTILN